MNKKFSIALAVLSLSILTTNAQKPEKDKQIQISQTCQAATSEINRLNGEMTDFFKQSKFNEAYSAGKKAADLTETACPEDKANRLLMAMNLAGIQIKRGKNEEARILFKDNLPAAETIYQENPENLNTYLNYLIKLSVNNASDGELEQYVQKSIQTKKALFGNESFEVMLEMNRMGGFYDRKKDFEKAEDYYLQAIAIYDKLPSDAKTEKIQVVNNYRAFLIRNFGDKGRKKDAEFMKLRVADMPASGGMNIVLNGRAISLPKPAYPAIARASRARGTVSVSVTIGENGEVIEAKATTGDQYLQQAAVDAAREAKFLPTYVNGQAIKVTGVIVYNFVP